MRAGKKEQSQLLAVPTSGISAMDAFTGRHKGQARASTRFKTGSPFIDR